MPPSPKDLIGTGLQVGGLAAKLGLKTAGAVAGRIKDATPFGSDDDEKPFDGPAGRTASSTGRFAREESPAAKPSGSKPQAAEPQDAKAGASEGTGTSARSTPKAGSTAAGSAAVGTKAVPRRISNPKAAAKARKREKATHLKSVDVSGESTGKGGNPATIHAENVPTERAAAHAGKEPAPMAGTVSESSSEK
jgi:hypothetical protein